MRRLLLAVVLLLPTIAFAQTATFTPTPTWTPKILHSTSYEMCASGGVVYYNDIGGTVSDSGAGMVVTLIPTPTGTPTPTTTPTYNYCERQFSAASGQAEYDYLNLGAQLRGMIHARVLIKTPPLTPRRIMGFDNRPPTTTPTPTPGVKQGCYVLVQNNIASVYYENEEYECGSSTNNGTECDTPVPTATGTPQPTATGTITPTFTPCCNETQGGEAICGNSSYGSTVLSGRKELSLAQQNAPDGKPGNVRCSLYVDGIERIGRTKPQGVCSGGDLDTYACAENDDCTGGGTCDTGDVVAFLRARLGVDDTAGSAMSFSADEFVVELNAERVMSSWQTKIVPSANDTYNDGWDPYGYGNIDDLLTTSFSHDGATTANTVSNPDKYRSYVLTDPNEETDTVLAVSVSLVGRETYDTAATKMLRTGLYADSTEIGGTYNDLTQCTGTNWFAVSPSTFDTEPDGSAWDLNDVDAVSAMVRTSSSSDGQIGVTAMVVEPLFQKPTPVIPTTLTDQNADGEITVTIMGDSRHDHEQLGTELARVLLQPDNIYQITHGGITTLDLYNAMTAALNGDLSAISDVAGPPSGRLVRGAEGKLVDYVLYDIGINSSHVYPKAPDEGECWTASPTPPRPSCQCRFEQTLAGRNAGSDPPAGQYCRSGAAFKTPCRTDVPRTPCPEDNYSDVWHQCDYDNPAWVCSWGCLGVPGCEDGVCVQAMNWDLEQRRQLMIMDLIAAHPSHAKVVFVLPPWTDRGGYGGLGCFLDDTLMADWALLKSEAERRGWWYVDLRAEFQDNCLPNRNSCLLDDGVHYSWEGSPNGDTLLAELAADCLVQTPNPNTHCPTPTPTPT